MPDKFRFALLLAMPALLLEGCATSFSENHYFRLRSDDGSVTTNYFRVRISGSAQMSSARYVSGYYDERAVDLFFDEIKSGSANCTTCIPSIFDGGEIELGSNGGKIEPLAPSPENGALLMIFSTNAKVVANAIGEFAESQVTADAITNLANRDKVREMAQAEAAGKADEQRIKAAGAEIKALVDALPADGGVTAEVVDGALRILSAFAQQHGHNEAFTTIAEARAWFAAFRAKGAAS
jgi:hypothetical protein